MGLITWNMADCRGQLWHHSEKQKLEAWVAQRNEMIFTAYEAMRRLPRCKQAFSTDPPGFGYAIPEDGSLAVP